MVAYRDSFHLPQKKSVQWGHEKDIGKSPRQSPPKNACKSHTPFCRCLKIRSKCFASCHNEKGAFYAYGSDTVVPSKVQLQNCRKGGRHGDVCWPRSPVAKGRLVGLRILATDLFTGVRFDRIIGSLGRQQPNSKRDALDGLLGYRKKFFDFLLLILC